MVFALAAPAFAVTDVVDIHDHTSACESEETIQPRVPTLPCCGATEYYARYRWDVKNSSKCGRCIFGYSGCNDNYATKYIGVKCDACGTVNNISGTESGYYCPTANNYKYPSGK